MQTFRERVLASSRERGSRVVLALDVSGPFGQRVARATRVLELGGGVILLVYMSHRGVNEGYTLRLDGGRRLYQAFAERAKRWGADGTIVSARSRAALRETRKIVGGDCLIFAPGVGAQGGEAEAAMASGADFIIVGRSVIDSGEPSREAERLRRATRKPSK